MTNKATKRALLTSIISLVICVVMLAGTTFAWFTDSVVSGKNQIVAGNLDVELYHTNENVKDADVKGDTNLFVDKNGDAILWEPGVVVYENLTVKNVGTLALKYQFDLTIYDEQKTPDGRSLSDVIKVAYVKGGVANDATRDDLIALKEWSDIADIADADELDAGKDKTTGIVLYWAPSANDNYYNMNNENQGKTLSITFGLNLIATQNTVEEDSFNELYDENAVYADYYVYTDAEFDAAIAAAKEGDIIALYAGTYTMPMNDTWWKATDLPDNTTIFGAEDGVKLTPASNGSTEVGEQGRIQANGYTFKNVTFTNTVSPNGYGKFIDCTFEGYNGLRQGAYKKDTQFINCEFNNANGWAFHTEYLYDSDVYFMGCKFKGLVEFTDTVADTDKVYFDNCVFAGSDRTSSGKIFYAWKNNAVLTDCALSDKALFEGCTIDGASKYVASQSDLNSALSSGEKDIYVGEGTYTFPASSLTEDTTIVCEEGTVFDGSSSLNVKGATVEGATFSNPSGNSVGGTVNGKFKGCTFKGSNALRGCYAGETVVFEDCVFDGGVYGVHFDGGTNNAIFTRCTFSGFNAFGSALTKLTFNECTFVKLGNSAYNGVNLWGDTELNNCEFTFDGSAAYEWVDVVGDNKTVTFNGCTKNGAPLTSADVGNYGTGNTITINA